MAATPRVWNGCPIDAQPVPSVPHPAAARRACRQGLGSLASVARLHRRAAGPAAGRFCGHSAADPFPETPGPGTRRSRW